MFRLAGGFIIFGVSTAIPSLIVRISPVDMPLMPAGSAPVPAVAIAGVVYLASSALAPATFASIGKMLVHLAMPLFFIQLISLGWRYAHSPSTAQLADGPMLKSVAQLARNCI